MRVTFLLVCVLIGYGCDSEEVPDASDVMVDQQGDSADGASLDQSTKLDGSGDASLCGNGEVDEGEACDGNSIACNELSALLDGSDANCRSDCSGYDVSTCDKPHGADWEIVKPGLRDPKWATAKCNDGTPFDFIVKLGTGSDWVILLQGGGWADEEAFLFDGREANLVTELEAPDRFHGPVELLGGILRSDAVKNERFHNANVAFAHYCSSDLWTGTGTAPQALTSIESDYTFSGRINVRTMLSVLKERYGLEDNVERKVLFGGQSAGCIGAGQTVDEVAEALPNMSAASKVHLLADGAYIFPFPDGSTWGRSTLQDGPLFSKALNLWTGEVADGCNQTERGECLLGEHAFKNARESHNIETLAVQSPFDFVVLALHGICSPGCKAANDCLVPTCRELDAAGYADLSAQLSSAFDRGGITWSYKHEDTLHVISGTDELWNGPLNADPTIKEVVTSFFDDGEPSRITVNQMP